MYVGDTCKVWCRIICHQYVATWKLKDVETFYDKVNFLLLYLCRVHSVNASSSSESRGETRLPGWGTGTPSTLPFGILSTYHIFLVFQVGEGKKKLLSKKGSRICCQTGFIWRMVMFLVLTPGTALEQAGCMEGTLELKAPPLSCSWSQWGCSWLDTGRVSWYYSGMKHRGKKTAWGEKKPNTLPY